MLAHIVWKKMKERSDFGGDDIDGAVFVERALGDVREKYPPASPNEGFLEQLELWVNMGCRLVATDETYKLFKHSQLERIRRERGCVDRGAVEEDPEKEMKNNNGAMTGSISQYYSCRKCRRILATSKNVLEHESGTGIDAFSWRQRRRGNDGGATKTSSSSCSSIFVSPITWMMLDQTEENEPLFSKKTQERSIVQNVARKLALSRGLGNGAIAGRLSRRLFTYRKQSSTRLRSAVRTANRKEKSVFCSLGKERAVEV